MNSSTKEKISQRTIEEKRIQLEEKRLLLEDSFAKKWLPALATLMVGIVAGLISWTQQHSANQMTERIRIESNQRAELEYGFKVIEMYFDNRELFDLTSNPEQASSNLEVLVEVAPSVVKGVFLTEFNSIPLPGEIDDSSRFKSLAAAASVQDALERVTKSNIVMKSDYQPSDFTVYIQYPDGQRESADLIQSFLESCGYHVPGIELVRNPPSRLQVRYYRTKQKSHSEDLSISLGRELNLITSADNAILVANSNKELPDGILEVWIPPEKSDD